VEEGWYATEFNHITDAQECLSKALALKFDDPELMVALQEHQKCERRSKNVARNG
jgi:hypothetical protein